MSFRQIYVKNADKLSLENNNLVIDYKQKKSKVPIEDINFVVVEDPRCVMTARVLTELSKNYVSLILCDETYTPNTYTLPLNTHYKQLKVFNQQLGQKQRTKERLWQSIIKQKILNQIEVIKLTENDMNSIELLQGYEKEIQGYDTNNREGIASKVFFSAIYGNKFVRDTDDSINACLDYGYGIIKGAILRTLVSFGANTNLGIWHSSGTNSFNLAYDFIEPLRPIVDYFTYWHNDYISRPLPFNIRKKLIDLLNKKVEIDKKVCTMQYAIETMIKSYIRVLENEKEELVLPKIIKIDFLE